MTCSQNCERAEEVYSVRERKNLLVRKFANAQNKYRLGFVAVARIILFAILRTRHDDDRNFWVFAKLRTRLEGCKDRFNAEDAEATQRAQRYILLVRKIANAHSRSDQKENGRFCLFAKLRTRHNDDVCFCVFAKLRTR